MCVTVIQCPTKHHLHPLEWHPILVVVIRRLLHEGSWRIRHAAKQRCIIVSAYIFSYSDMTLSYLFIFMNLRSKTISFCNEIMYLFLVDLHVGDTQQEFPARVLSCIYICRLVRLMMMMILLPSPFLTSSIYVKRSLTALGITPGSSSVPMFVMCEIVMHYAATAHPTTYPSNTSGVYKEKCTWYAMINIHAII